MYGIRIILTILFILGVNSLSFAEEANMTNYFIAMEGRNVSGLVKINGCPVVQINNAPVVMDSEQINKWLVNGKNTIEITYPDYLQKADGEMVVHLQKGDELPGSDRLALLKASPANKLFYEFEIKDLPENDLSKADYIDDLGYDDKVEISNLVNRFYKSMDGKSFPVFMDLTKLKLSEEARIHGASLEELQQIFEMGYMQNFQNGLKHYKLLDSADMQYSVVFKHKIVHVSGKHSFGVIFHNSEEKTDGLPVYVSRIKGEWQIVR